MCVEAFPGRVLALLGVNGAGKSTLMNVIGGVITPDQGSVSIHGREIRNSSPNVARANGIAFIQQEVQLFDNLTVYENIFLMNLASYRRVPALPMLDKKRLIADARALLTPLGCRVNPARKVGSLSVGEQQMVQIARALSSGGDILLFDEPTSSLSLKEKENLFEVIRKLRADGKTIIYITHYLDEVETICDQVVVMRDGQVVRKGDVRDLSKAEIIASMVPEKVAFNTEESAAGDEVVLRVENLGGERLPKNVSFDLHRGEVLGLWGLLGSGRTETVRILLGLRNAGLGFLGGISVCVLTGALVGLIGLCDLQLAKLKNPRLVIGVDVQENRLALGKKLGADHVFNPRACDVDAEVKKLTGGLGCDVYIHCSGYLVLGLYRGNELQIIQFFIKSENSIGSAPAFISSHGITIKCKHGKAKWSVTLKNKAMLRKHSNPCPSANYTTVNPPRRNVLADFLYYKLQSQDLK